MYIKCPSDSGNQVRFEVLIVMTVRITVLWDVSLHSVADLSTKLHDFACQKTVIFSGDQYLLMFPPR
jgi:hypothetical protein